MDQSQWWIPTNCWFQPADSVGWVHCWRRPFAQPLGGRHQRSTPRMMATNQATDVEIGWDCFQRSTVGLPNVNIFHPFPIWPGCWHESLKKSTPEVQAAFFQTEAQRGEHDEQLKILIQNLSGRRTMFLWVFFCFYNTCFMFNDLIT